MSLSDYRRSKGRPDWLLALMAVGLVVFGLAMILSASAYLAGSSGNVYQFVSRQLVSFGIGLVVMVIFTQIDSQLWRRWAGPLLAIVLLFLLMVFISPACRGVHRCIDFGPVRFQPAEFVKLAFLVYLAAWLANRATQLKSLQTGFLSFLLLIGVVGGLILLEPDMGTAMTLIIAAVIMYFLAGAPWNHLLVGLVVGGGLLFLLVLIAPYRAARLQTFLQPSSDVQGAGYHTNQVGIAIGSGGWWGLGFGQGKLKYLGYVPEVHTDSIFAVIVEELGFVRALLVLGALLFLINRGYRVARFAPDQFSRLLVSGIISLIAVQMFINLAAMLRVLPLTGIPLPFISYGGSSLIATLASLGIVLSVSRSRVAAEERI